MIVPVILDYNLINKTKTDGLWIFYKFLDFCEKNNTNIIGREIYYKDSKNYEKLWDLNINTRKMYEYQYPSKKALEKNKKFMISQKIENEMFDKKINWSYLLTKNYKPLEKELNRVLDLIENEKKEKIDAIITWYPFECIKKVCNNRKIKMISIEFSAIRKEFYDYTLCSFSKYTKYDAKKDYQKYYNMDFKDKIVLTREELLILLSYKNELLYNLKLLKSSPIYEIGYALGLKSDPYEEAYSKYSQKDIINRLINLYPKNNLLFRPHPQSKEKIRSNIDDSNTAREFISKCNKIIVIVSNVGYEAMLYNRRVSHLMEGFLTSFGVENSLEKLNDSTISLEKLNFITFGLYHPYSEIFDFKKLTKKIYQYDNENINNIYISNMKSIFKDKNLDYDYMKNTCGEKRMRYMLKQIHNFNSHEINEVLGLTYNKNSYDKSIEFKNQIIRLEEQLKENKYIIENLEKEKENLSKINQEKDFCIQDLKNINSTYEKELKAIKNSKVWICAEKYRKIRNNVFRR